MNKNPLATIEKLLDSVVPYYSNNHIVPRGTIYPLDPLFTGSFYTMFQWGSGYDTLLYSANTFKLLENVSAQYVDISVDVILPSLEVGDLLRIGDTNDSVRVRSIDVENNVLRVSTGTKGHDAGEVVTLYAKKCLVESDTNLDSPLAIKDRVVFRIAQPVLLGSKLAVIISPDYQKQATYEIVKINDMHMDGDDYIYDVQLDAALFINLSYGDSIYFIAYPYYISESLTIPKHFATKVELGPFLLDFNSINMKDATVDTEYNITLYDTSNNIVAENITDINYPVYNRDINSSSFMFSDVLIGKVSYTTDGLFVGYIEEGGEFQCYTELQPRVEPLSGISWSFDITVVGDVHFFVDVTDESFHYSSYLVSGSSYTITVTPETGKLMKGIMLGIKGSEGSYFKMSDWRVNTKVSRVEYTILSKNLEPALWLGSGLILKPLFPIVDDIKFVFGKTLFNNGKIFI